MLSLSGVAWADDDEEQVEFQERAGRKLSDRIPSVTRRYFEKGGRVELSPTFSLTINDPFFTHLVVGGGIYYHINENFFVGAGGEFFGSIQNDVSVVGGAGVTQPTLNRPVYAARLEVGWAPIYGKISLFAEQVLHFDMYVSVGGGVIGLDESDPSVAGTIALGQRYFVNDWYAVRIELRDHLFGIQRVPGGAQGSQFENLFSGAIGLSFFVPPTFEREAL